MSTHVKVELLDVHADDTEDWGLNNPDEFYIKSAVYTDVAGDDPKPRETSRYEIWSDTPAQRFLPVDSLIFNDIVPIQNST